MKRVDNKDWCTAFPDRVAKINYSGACKAHDLRYADKSKSRWTADLEFFNDNLRRGRIAMNASKYDKAWGRLAVQMVASPFLAVSMWLGVRLIGWKFYGKKE